jgi:hypothetical protein
MTPVVHELEVRYYGPHDTLHIFFSGDEWTIGSEPAPGVIVRKTDKGSLVAVTILEVHRRSRAELSRLLPFVDPEVLAKWTR